MSFEPVVDAAVLREAGVTPVWVDARPGDHGRLAHQARRLVGAVHVDLDEDMSGDQSEPQRGGRHPLPTPSEFARRLEHWGIDPSDFVVAYDDKGGAFAAARFWWMLRALGHRRVAILSGGLSAATSAGYSTESGELSSRPRSNYSAPSEWQKPTVDQEQVGRMQSDAECLLFDVRAPQRYRGENEPIDPVAGHIPGAVNAPYELNLAEDGRFLSPEALRAAYRQHFEGRTPSKVVVSCGSGVTACHTLAALEHAGWEGASLYVGSFSEWCRSSKPLAKGSDP